VPLYHQRVSPENGAARARAVILVVAVLTSFSGCRRQRSNCEQVARLLTGQAQASAPNALNTNGGAGTGIYPPFMFNRIAEQCVDTFDDEMIACLIRSEGELTLTEQCVAAHRARTGARAP
jgi:hypothetical protein